MNNTIRKFLKPIRILKQNVCYHSNNFYGKDVGNRHILVIESDDWGSIRVPNDIVKDTLNKQGAKLDIEPFTKFDGLESAKDISDIVHSLKTISDINGRNPIVTAFYAVSNAHFEAIRENNFSLFIGEPFLKTCERYDNNTEMLKTIKFAIEEKVFHPELHCCEHLNRYLWMNDLKNGKLDTLEAFKNNMYGLGTNFTKNNPYGYMDAFHNRSEEELYSYREIISSAVSNFKDIFGYTPKVFTAPCFVWDSKLEDYLYEKGIQYICGANHQFVPQKGNYDYLEHKCHKLGEKNRHGIIYLTRNVEFELIYGDKEAHEKAIRQIRAAYDMKKPAIISIHRANFSSRIGKKQENRLSALIDLINDVKRMWPDVEFMSSYELGEVYRGEK